MTMSRTLLGAAVAVHMLASIPARAEPDVEVHVERITPGVRNIPTVLTFKAVNQSSTFIELVLIDCATFDAMGKVLAHEHGVVYSLKPGDAALGKAMFVGAKTSSQSVVTATCRIDD
jgi:hypothetical protein